MNKEPKNGGFPNTEKMIKALLEVLVFRFDDESSKNFDDITEKYANEFQRRVQDKLDLDPDTREWMDRIIEENEKRDWMRGDQAHHPHDFTN